MAITGVKVTFDKHSVMMRIRAAADEATYAISAQALSDANRYVRYDQGIAKDSSEIHSDLRRGILRWQTIYIRKIYYTGIPRTDKNPKASKMWAHKASSMHKKDWIKIGQTVLKRKV